MNFLNMELLWTYVIFVTLFFNLSFGSFYNRPVMSTPGTVRVVCLLDLHQSASVTDINKCMTPKPDVLQMALVATWKLDTILNDTQSTDIGMSVYDTCGSQERAVRILSTIIGDSNIKLGGVISYTTPVVTSAINGVLRHLHVLHMDITDDVTSCRDEISCVSVSLASRVKAEAVQELTRALNWTYVTTLSLSNIRATAEERLFADMTEKDVCLSGRHVISDIRDVTQSLEASSSRGIVLFTGDLDLSGTSTLSLPVSNTLIIVSKDFKGLEQQRNYIRLATTPIIFEGFAQYLLTVKDNATLQWITDMSYFQGNCLTAGSDARIMLVSCVSPQSKPGTLAMTDAINILAQSLMAAINASCQDLDVLTCHPMSLAVKLGSVHDLTNFTQRSGGDDPLLVEHNIVVMTHTSISEQLNTTEILTQHGRLNLPSSLPMPFHNSHCSGFCSECSACKPLFTSSEKVVMQDGTIFIVGIFPIHGSSSTSGLPCAEPNIPGFQAAQAFTAAVDGINSTGIIKDLPRDVSLGWAMFDSCGDDDSFERKHHEIETCMYDYKDANDKTVIIQPSRTIAYVNLGLPRMVSTKSKFSASVSSLGVDIDGDAYMLYAQTIVSTIKSIKWTYTSIIYSDDYISKTIFNNLQNLADSYVCFERVYQFSSNYQSILEKATSDTRTVIILSNLTDTRAILNNAPNSLSRTRLLLMPWNVDAIRNTNVSSAIHEVLVIWPRADPANSRLGMSGNPWYEGFQSTPSSATGEDFFVMRELSESSLIVHAVNILAGQINTAYTHLCPEKRGICDDFSDFEKLKHYVKTPDTLRTRYEITVLRRANGSTSSHKVGEIEASGSVRLIRDGTVVLPHPSECNGWCPRCQSCRKTTSSATPPAPTPLYLPGDILIAGVLPLSDSGEGGLTCGDLSTSLESEQLVEAFMFAVDTYRKRYPYLLPNVKAGGLVIDSCSDVSTAVQKVVNFETCSMTFGDTELLPTPSQTLGYVLHGNSVGVTELERSVAAVNKLAISTVSDGVNRYVHSRLATEYEIFSEVSTIIQTLATLNWTQILLVTSDTEAFRSKADIFLEQASIKHICVTKLLQFNGTILNSLQYATSQLTLTGFVPVVMMASKSDTLRLFQQSSVTRVPRSWIISTAASDWSTLTDLHVPAGTVLVDRKGKLSTQFADFYSSVQINTNSSVWWKQYWQEKIHCSLAHDTSSMRPLCPIRPTKRHTNPSQLATRVILAVDVILHAVHNQYVTSCEGKNGFCRRFADQGLAQIPSAARKVTFEFEDEIVKFAQSGLLIASYNILSVHQQGHVQVGEWMNGHLHLDYDKLYNRGGQLTSSSTQCHDSCVCVNAMETRNTYSPPEAIYWESSGAFNGELWATIIVAIAAAGAFVTAILMFYVLYKVCTGALAKRYVGLGLLLLLGVMMLYLSVLPFVFTPSDRVCALRFFAPGFTYCLCFGTVLVKMTSIRDYKLIGLGGEVSNLNQFLTVFFITSVQIAIGIQYWALKGPFITEKDEAIKTVYACEFQRSEFLVYLVYVMFVLVMCSLYGIGVRKEQKNMNEARLLLTSSWLCLLLWLAWILLLMFLDITLIEPIVSSGILACATIMLTVIFIPKMHLVARLKYNVSKQSTAMHNGHKLDPDFMFERPYSLPGTLTSSYSSVKTYPRSIEHFDSSLSY